jgi:hypothetical protein
MGNHNSKIAGKREASPPLAVRFERNGGSVGERPDRREDFRA